MGDPLDAARRSLTVPHAGGGGPRADPDGSRMTQAGQALPVLHVSLFALYTTYSSGERAGGGARHTSCTRERGKGKMHGKVLVEDVLVEGAHCDHEDSVSPFLALLLQVFE